MNIIKKFEEELIKEELKLKTIKNYISNLNWGDDKIHEYTPLLDGDIDTFINTLSNK